MHIDYAKNHTRVCTSHSGIICSWIAASQSICKPLSDHPPIVGLAGHVQLTLFFHHLSCRGQSRLPDTICYLIFTLRAHVWSHATQSQKYEVMVLPKDKFWCKGGLATLYFPRPAEPSKVIICPVQFLGQTAIAEKAIITHHDPAGRQICTLELYYMYFGQKALNVGPYTWTRRSCNPPNAANAQ